MMKKINYIKIILFSMAIMFYGCQEDDYSFGDIITPSNIQINAELVGADANNPNGDGSGEVKFTVTADNAVSYKFVYEGVEYVTLSGEQSIIFSKLGLNTYTITAVASGTAGVTSSKTIQVDVLATYSPPNDLTAKLYGFDPANPTVQTEEIFVRVTDTNASTVCFRADTSFTLTVNPLPIILNPIWKVEQCDNPLFDLTDYDEKLSTYFDSETFTYFNEAGEEISLDDAKNYTSTSTSVDPEIIDVVFTKNIGGCSRTGQIELKVSYSQVPSDFAQTFIAANQNDVFKS